jgi:hypothetical protein
VSSDVVRGDLRSNFIKIHSVAAESFHVDGRTEGHDEDITLRTRLKTDQVIINEVQITIYSEIPTKHNAMSATS